jgi:hypothetical protein
MTFFSTDLLAFTAFEDSRRRDDGGACESCLVLEPTQEWCKAGRTTRGPSIVWAESFTRTLVPHDTPLKSLLDLALIMVDWIAGLSLGTP